MCLHKAVPELNCLQKADMLQNKAVPEAQKPRAQKTRARDQKLTRKNPAHRKHARAQVFDAPEAAHDKNPAQDGSGMPTS